MMPHIPNMHTLANDPKASYAPYTKMMTQHRGYTNTVKPGEKDTFEGIPRQLEEIAAEAEMTLEEFKDTYGFGEFRGAELLIDRKYISTKLNLSREEYYNAFNAIFRTAYDIQGILKNERWRKPGGAQKG